MGWWGKLVGGAFGYMLGGPIGALLGAAMGHNLDRGLGNLRGDEGFRPGQQERVQTAFFSSTFLVLGHLAKADGRVSADEIAAAESIMGQMALNSEMRRTAIGLFNEGKQDDFPLDDVLQQFKQECHGRRPLIQMFVEIQLQAAYADGTLHPAEKQVLLHVCATLGFSRGEFNALDGMIRAELHGRTRHRAHAERAGPTLSDAYAILNLNSSATDDEVKKAYRRLMSQHHPDKLVAKGLPEEMMKMAAQKTHEIKTSYDTIRKSRNF